MQYAISDIHGCYDKLSICLFFEIKRMAVL